MQEMSAAWQMTVDMSLGLFRADPPEKSPLIQSEGEFVRTEPPYVIPHNIWTKVSVPDSHKIIFWHKSVVMDDLH